MVCVCLRGGGTYSSMINGVCVFEGRGHIFVNDQWCVCVFEGRGHVFVNDQWCVRIPANHPGFCAGLSRK